MPDIAMPQINEMADRQRGSQLIAMFILYPVDFAACKTVERVASLTVSGLLRALETVAVETPANFATSLIVIVFMATRFALGLVIFS